MTVPKGATMFFHGHLIHGSGPNRTKDRFRRTFGDPTKVEFDL